MDSTYQVQKWLTDSSLRTSALQLCLLTFRKAEMNLVSEDQIVHAKYRFHGLLLRISCNGYFSRTLLAILLLEYSTPIHQLSFYREPDHVPQIPNECKGTLSHYWQTPIWNDRRALKAIWS